MAEKVKDQVCQMEIEKDKAVGKSEYKAQIYYFCSMGCKKQFEKDPRRYAMTYFKVG